MSALPKFVLASLRPDGVVSADSTHPSTSVPLVLPTSVKVTLPPESSNFPCEIDTSESLRRLKP